jgi:hypothetical protein
MCYFDAAEKGNALAWRSYAAGLVGFSAGAV